MEITTLKYKLPLNLYGWKDSTLEDLMNEWTSPGINVEEVIRVVENEDGDIIGYIDVWDNTNPHVIKYVWGILHPDAWDAELYQEMLTWSQTCARERIDLAPEATGRLAVEQLLRRLNAPSENGQVSVLINPQLIPGQERPRSMDARVSV